MKGAQKIRTITFPNTVKEAQGGAFQENKCLRSAILNEGLERLEGGDGNDPHYGVFTATHIKKIALPPALKTLEASTFLGCKELKCVTFREGCRPKEFGLCCFGGTGIEEITVPRSVITIRELAFGGCWALKRILFQSGSELKTIEERCFSRAGIEEIWIPGTVETIGDNAFEGCDSLGTVHVENGCEVNLFGTGISDATKVVLSRETMAWGAPLQRLRELKEVVVPEGTERIGNNWFWGSDVERVTVAASVREIGVHAFRSCKNLKHITFAEGSQLEKIGAGSFQSTGIERVVVPKDVNDM